MPEIEISFDPSLIRKVALLGILIGILALELQVTMNSPIAFGDEGFHVANARYMAENVEYPKYTPLFGSDLIHESFRRPALWNSMEGGFYMLFGFNDMIIKFLMPFISFLTGIVIFTFVRRLYSENAALLAAVLSVTIPAFVTYSVLFYTTVPYVFLLSIAFLSFLTAMKTGGWKYWVLAGVFSGLSVLANIAGAFMLILVVVMGVVHLLRNRSLAGIVDAARTYGLVLLISMLIISPWVVRNLGLYGGADCSITERLEGTCADRIEYETVTQTEFVARNAGGVTEGSVLSMGIPGYLQFAYGFSSNNFLVNLIGFAFIPFSFLAGLVVLAKRREVTDIALMASSVIFFLIFLQLGGLIEGRAEDTSRYFLSMAPIVGIVAAVYWSSMSKTGHKANSAIIVVVLVVVIALAMVSFYSKIVYMPAVKNFPASFLQACDWIQENTPEGSNMLSLHTYPTRYNCDRGSVWEIPDKRDILLSNNVSIIKDRLDANGIDYVFVQKFAMTSQPVEQAFPIQFVGILDNDNSTFTKVYENGPTFNSQEFIDCAQRGNCDIGTIVYRVN